MRPKEIEIPILTAGDYGEAGRWSEDDLGRMAASYDPERFAAPLVVGHPAHDAPAHGWVRSLRLAGRRLLARIGGLSDEVVRQVREGRFKKISAALYPGSDKAPPRLKHVGLLGALAPRDPSLPVVAFGEVTPGEMRITHTLEWPAAPSWIERALRSLLGLVAKDAEIEEVTASPEPTADPAQPAVAFGEMPAGPTDAEIRRFLRERTAEGKLPPVFAHRGGEAFLQAMARQPVPVHFAEDLPPANACQWLMETVGAFPAIFFGEKALVDVTAPRSAEERLYERAFDRLDAQQALRSRGVTLELFRKVYRPEDCRMILAESN